MGIADHHRTFTSTETKPHSQIDMCSSGSHKSDRNDVPPPPPPPPLIGKTAPKLPSVASEGPAGSYMVELLIFNGWPFKDHWAYWVRSHSDPDIGVQLHATGDVRNGFEFQIKRNYDFHDENSECPSTGVPLQ